MKAMILMAGGNSCASHYLQNSQTDDSHLAKASDEFLLELLRQHGFDQIMVNVSHLANEIESYFRDGQRFGGK